MRLTITGVLLSFWMGAATSATDVARAEAVTLRTAYGDVRGTQENNVRVFKNLPYAAPPVGTLRWRPPQPPARWTGIRDALQFGPPCAQLDVTRMKDGRHVSGPGFDIFIDVPMPANASEDCLSLNVWTPGNATKAPVMVFIYGGGGSADMPWWDGTGFARDGVVLVTFNYRNLTMGKFAHPALTKAAAPGEPLSRYDLMDQMAALAWVRDNIAAFGGDPTNVTLSGQSAGGAAVLQLLTAPSSRGLFHKAIVQSSNAWWVAATQKENERLGSLLATKAGLPGANATVEQLRALAPDAMPQIGHFAVDGRLLPESPTDALAAKRIINVPLMIGWNSFDGSSLRYDPAKVVTEASPEIRKAYAADGLTVEDLAYDIYTDRHVGAPSRWVARQTENGEPTFVYHFSYVLPAQRGQVRGAAHGAELPHVFDSWSKAAPSLVLGADERRVTRMVHSCWVSFAKTGVPACEGAPEWPAYSTSKGEVMDLNASPQVRPHFRKVQLDAQENSMTDVLRAQRDMLDRLLSGDW